MQDKIQLLNISAHDYEQCLKCSICTVYCPVSTVEPEYPGPKHAGPDLLRYRLKDPDFFNETLKLCLNCKRCEVACPHGVKVGDIIQAARIEYSTHTPGLRDRMLASTDFVGSMATLVAPLTNFFLGLKPAKAVLDKVMKIDRHRQFPAYAGTKFETWFHRSAEAEQQKYSRFVSYFHGCYVNYNFPKLGQDLVKIMNACGYGVRLLEKEKCCGVALIANGLAGQAQKQGKVNVASMEKAVDAQSEAVLTTSSTCTFTMRDEYKDLLKIDNAKVRDHIMLATRFLCQKIDEGAVRLAFRKDFHKKVAYHTACHMERLFSPAATNDPRSRPHHAREPLLRHRRHLWLQEGELRALTEDRCPTLPADPGGQPRQRRHRVRDLQMADRDVHRLPRRKPRLAPRRGH